MGGADGDVVEQAKTHGAVRFGMVPRRPDGAKRLARLARGDGVDGGADRPGGPQRGLSRSRRDDGVGKIEIDPAGLGYGVDDFADVADIVHARKLGGLGARRVTPFKRGEFGAPKRLEDGTQPVRRFGMRIACVVLDACRMGEDEGRHRPAPCGSAATGGRGGETRYGTDVAIAPIGAKTALEMMKRG